MKKILVAISVIIVFLLIIFGWLYLFAWWIPIPPGCRTTVINLCAKCKYENWLNWNETTLCDQGDLTKKCASDQPDSYQIKKIDKSNCKKFGIE